jgi:RIO-like serine/threonine protein kinase
MRLDLSALKYLTPDDFRVLTAIEMGMRNHEIVPVDLIESIAKLKRVSTSKIIANLLKHKLIKHTNIKYDGYCLNFLGYDYLAIHALIKKGILMKIGTKLGVGKESDVFVCYVNLQNVNKECEINEEETNKVKQEFVKDSPDAEEESEGEEEENEEEDNGEEEESGEEEKNEEEKLEDVKDKPPINDENPLETKNAEEDFNIFENEINILNTTCHIAVLKLARLGRTTFRAVKSKRDFVKEKSHYNWLYLSRFCAVNDYNFLSG